jgi:FAD binding domain/Berberine and berberine like
MFSQTALQKFREALRGPSFCPEEAGYDSARKLPNAMIDRRPAVIARCAGAADVIECVRFAREHGLLVAVRGGGHSVAGKSMCDGGLVVDLSAMKGIRVDPGRRTARAQTGLTLAEFDRETQAFNLATTLGTVSTTGIAGLTLGAGWGNLHGRFGLALDNVIAADIVTADGQLLTVSAGENPDLFWGVRGGGGTFGVVTSLEYRLHEVGPVLGGAVFWPVAKTKEVLTFLREYAATAPDELVMQCTALTLPDAGRVFAIAACYSGPLDEGENVLKPLRAFGPPIADIFDRIRYVQMQKILDPFLPQGRYTYTKSNFFRDMNDASIEVMASFAKSNPSPHMFAPLIEHWHGAANRVPISETAFPHRQYSFNFLLWSTWEHPAESERNIRWTRDCWESMRPFLTESSYGNYISDEGDRFAHAAYGANYERLVALKNKYDPTNVFRMNHNIQPTERTAIGAA